MQVFVTIFAPDHCVIIRFPADKTVEVDTIFHLLAWDLQYSSPVRVR